LEYSRQQRQTKNFFEKFSRQWSRNAKTKSNNGVNVIKQRNDYVLKIASHFLSKGCEALDVGCGTGDLTIQLLEKGFDAYGIDFASSMIKRARFEAHKKNFPQNRFQVRTFFEYSTDKKFDLISANGFIEYISEKQFDQFIRMCNKFLKHNGLLVFSSRNRLFNVFSFNNYTLAEIKIKHLTYLIEECVLFNKIKIFNELLRAKYIPKISLNLQTHDDTGFHIDTRYQYTPCQVINKLQKHGFRAIDIIPIHIHVFTTGARSRLPKIHDFVSNSVQDKPVANLQLIPQASSFMITARKA
jgi:2-polyprenyl-3-methyl-5-hydroxy-6-metoxy-1,4-benzoquinol methylase